MKNSFRIVAICCLCMGILLCIGIYIETHKAASSPIATQQELKKDLIVVDAPLSAGAVSSPVHVTGKARGIWYFEGSFPIVVMDSSGNEIGVGHATAQSDWMTVDFVPFTADIDFSTPVSKSGTLVLKKDNPSGDPSRDDSLSIPIVFTSK